MTIDNYAVIARSIEDATWQSVIPCHPERNEVKSKDLGIIDTAKISRFRCAPLGMTSFWGLPLAYAPGNDMFLNNVYGTGGFVKE